MQENSYGDAKRLEFLRRAIRQRRPARVLDIGCGTGMRVTRPLAECFDDIAFLGSDSDGPSIEWAKAHNQDLANLRFSLPEDLPREEGFDLIIASEVIEHVADPYQFLIDLRAKLRPGGWVVLTLPNGFGPFEIMALSECLLRLSGVQAVIRRLKYAMLGRTRPPAAAEQDTLAVSPHINFFSFRDITRVIEAAGFVTFARENRSFLCGYILDSFIRGRIAELNARIADRLPAFLVSDWMFALEAAHAPRGCAYRRGRWASLKKRINERRWGIA